MTASAVHYISFEDVVDIIRVTGIGPIRDQGLLESSLQRPQVVLWGEETYPTLFEKAASLLQSLARNHALFDGNKRLAWICMHTFLAMNGWRIGSDDEEGNLQFMLGCARGDFELEQITSWLGAHAERIPT
jgi:death-on-curing protein